jgi:pyruvate/2-oxoglutarate dehydrogenase complex dihydrolipoamide acyltransferase (E2) component
MKLAMQDEVGRYKAKRVSFRRRLSMESFDALPQGHSMFALLELDVTDARAAVQSLRAQGERVSLFAYIAKCIATALAEHPALNAVRSGNRIYEFEDVDLNVPVEIEAKSGVAPHLVVVRRAAQKTPAQIYADIEAARAQFASRASVGREDRWAQRFMRVLMLLPKFMRRWLMRAVAGRALVVKRMTGTTFLTSVAKFAELRGFVLPYVAGPIATSFALGSTADKALVHDGQLQIRRCLHMTVAFNHDIVDGGPAARFTTRLAQLIERPCERILGGGEIGPESLGSAFVAERSEHPPAG